MKHSFCAAGTDQAEFIRVRAHHLENEQNPDGGRAARVREWLALEPLSEVDDSLLAQRTAELMALGFKNFDAFHLASSELMSADVFVTCDDRLLAAAATMAASNSLPRTPVG